MPNLVRFTFTVISVFALSGVTVHSLAGKKDPAETVTLTLVGNTTGKLVDSDETTEAGALKIEAYDGDTLLQSYISRTILRPLASDTILHGDDNDLCCVLDLGLIQGKVSVGHGEGKVLLLCSHSDVHAVNLKGVSGGRTGDRCRLIRRSKGNLSAGGNLSLKDPALETYGPFTMGFAAIDGVKAWWFGANPDLEDLQAVLEAYESNPDTSTLIYIHFVASTSAAARAVRAMRALRAVVPSSVTSPDEGYKLGTITVNGKTIVGNTFTMPNEAVKVVVTLW